MKNDYVPKVAGRGDVGLGALSKENSVNLNAIAGLYNVNQVIIKDNVNRPGKLTCRSQLGKLLNGARLEITVGAESVLCAERVTIAILWFHIFLFCFVFFLFFGNE
jgi:hypothetical protein